MVTADEHAVAQVDRAPQVQRRHGGRLRVRHGHAGQVVQVGGGDPVRLRDLPADVGLPGGGERGAGHQGAAVRGVPRLGVGEDDAVHQLPAGPAEDQQRLVPRRGGQHVQVRGDLAWSRGGHARQQARGRRRVGGDDDGVRGDRPGRGVDGPAPDGGDRAAQVQRPRRQPSGQLLAHRLHPAGGQPDAAAHEAAPQQVQVAARGVQPVLEQDAGEEGAEEALEHRTAQAGPLQRLGGGAFRRGEQPRHGEVARAQRERGQRRLLPQRADRGGRRRRQGRGPATRVDDGVRPAVDPHPRAGEEPAEVQRRQVEVGHPRVAGVEHLEAAVDDEPVDPLGRQPAAGVLRGLDDVHVAPGRGQPGGRGEPGQPGTDDHDLRTRRHRHRPNLASGAPVHLWTTGTARAPERLRSLGMPAPVPAPPVVPGYTCEELLGRGSTGEVWRAAPRRGGPSVAVKVLVEGDPQRQAREAALLGELDHPHLVRLVEVVHQPRRGGAPRVALVLDLLEGAASPTCWPRAAGSTRGRW